jgi:hypothetical protein
MKATPWCIYVLYYSKLPLTESRSTRHQIQMHATVCNLLILDYQDILVHRDGSNFFLKEHLLAAACVDTSGAEHSRDIESDLHEQTNCQEFLIWKTQVHAFIRATPLVA